jgi:hypothetical protein
VWHVSIARLSKRMDRVFPVSDWPNSVMRQAVEMADRILSGVGGEWRLQEIGDCAIHHRRRLSVSEMKHLLLINANCPVFTHGKAMSSLGLPKPLLVERSNTDAKPQAR